MKKDSSDAQQRKRRRMQSNRESAQRSRMRKHKYMDDLTAEVAHLSKQNNQISNTINATTHHCLKLEAHNSVLRAQIIELSQRFHSLKQILFTRCVFEADHSNFGDALLGLTHHHPIDFDIHY
ncbi:bZIP transcription factor 11-like [Salvia divinorum]|uniref:BZIP transcription factor 11-like n=1 Tax=Salvia divinorum TaxID=28513 RepID=A0ABD1FSL1_SALDI